MNKVSSELPDGSLPRHGDGAGLAPTDEVAERFRQQVEGPLDETEQVTERRADEAQQSAGGTLGERMLRGFDRFTAHTEAASERVNAALASASGPGGFGILKALEIQAVLLDKRIGDKAVEAISKEINKTVETLTNPR